MKQQRLHYVSHKIRALGMNYMPVALCKLCIIHQRFLGDFVESVIVIMLYFKAIILTLHFTSVKKGSGALTCVHKWNQTVSRCI